MSKLEVIIRLKELDQACALVREGKTALGIVSLQGLIEQLDRHQSISVAPQLAPDSM